MKIITISREDRIECRLPNGHIVEITMISLEGEENRIELDIHEAVRLVRQNFSNITNLE